MVSESPRAQIHQVLTSVGAALGVSGHTDVLGLPDARKFVVLVIDGLGLQQLNDHAELAPFLSSQTNISGVVSGVPSTTSVSLTSLGTGLRPGSHGMAGYTCRVPGTNRYLNTLSWDDSVDPQVWQPHRPLLAQFADEGISTAVVNSAAFERSGLTRCGWRGAPFVGADNAWERLGAVCDVTESADRAVVYAYESRIDMTGHGDGVDSDTWRTSLTAVDAEVAQLRAELDDDVALLVTADHGMVDVPVVDRFDLVNHPRLRDEVILVAGEARFRHVYTATGAEQQVANRWRKLLGERAEVRLRDETEDWFGPLDPLVRARFGDVLIAARDDFAVFDSSTMAIELQLRGFHGSVTDAERQIPLLVAF